MKELGEALKILFMKVGDFFDIFDLSFFVSGIASASAIIFGAELAGTNLTPIFQSRLWILLGGLLAYISGLASFAAGRWLRQTLVPILRRKNRYDDFDEHFNRVLKGHGLVEEDPFKSYLARTKVRGIWRLYVRLWAELRHSDTVVPSLQLLRRYWVMAATYDGIAISFMLWSFLTFLVTFDVAKIASIPKIVGLPIAIGLLILFVCAIREASRYVDYQVEELVATIAAAKKKGNS
jgi:hypothetical protein